MIPSILPLCDCLDFSLLQLTDTVGGQETSEFDHESYTNRRTVVSNPGFWHQGCRPRPNCNNPRQVFFVCQVPGLWRFNEFRVFLWWFMAVQFCQRSFFSFGGFLRGRASAETCPVIQKVDAMVALWVVIGVWCRVMVFRPFDQSVSARECLALSPLQGYSMETVTSRFGFPLECRHAMENPWSQRYQKQGTTWWRSTIDSWVVSPCFNLTPCSEAVFEAVWESTG